MPKLPKQISFNSSQHFTGRCATTHNMQSDSEFMHPATRTSRFKKDSAGVQVMKFKPLRLVYFFLVRVFVRIVIPLAAIIAPERSAVSLP
jgi:hypothetical protein